MKARAAGRAGALLLAMAVAALLAVTAGEAPAQKYGGVLRLMARNNPGSLSPQEEASIETAYPAGPLFGNLVFYPSTESVERLETITPELSESWVWTNGNRNLVFKLRRGLLFHDGKPVTAKDVKFTFDTFRGVAGAYKPKMNPRKDWWDNIQEITTAGDFEVTFQLKRPQPSLLALLASGYSPVYPAHRDPRLMRTEPVGTGPFKLKAWERDRVIQYTKNPAYFLKDRPYLDGVTFTIIKNRATRDSALIAGQADMTHPGEDTQPIYETYKAANRGFVFTPNVASSVSSLLINTKVAPFNDTRMQRALNLALDRLEFTRGVRQGGNTTSGTLLPAPFGVWGLTPEDLAAIPGYGDGPAGKEEARKLMRAMGYGPEKPLKVKMTTRQQESYAELAVWATGQLKEIWIEATLEQVESTQWYARLARQEYQIGTNSQGSSVDDPDAVFYEHFSCGSHRNATGYCDAEMEKRFDEQSQELDFAKRLPLVKAIDRDLQLAAIRPMLGFRHHYNTRYPYVKGYTPRQKYEGNSRFQDLWLDK